GPAVVAASRSAISIGGLTLLVVEGVRRADVRIGVGALAGLLELLLEDLLLVLVLLDRALELLVQDAALALDAVHQIVEVLGRGLLLVHPDDRARLRVHLEQRSAARSGDVDGLGHGRILAPPYAV